MNSFEVSRVAGGSIAGNGVPAGDAADIEGYAHHLRYQEAFEFAPDCQVVTDGHGLILEANHAATVLLHCPKPFLTGKPLGLFVAKGYRERFYSGLTWLNRGHLSDSFEVRLIGRNHEQPQVWICVVARNWESGPRGNLHWMIRDVTARRQAEAERHELMSRLVTAHEDERRRIARELHDSVGQLLTALTLAVTTVREAAPLPPASDARLEEVERLAHQLGREVRDLAVRLRPPALDDLGLDAALAQHLRGWSTAVGIEVDYQPSGVQVQRLPPEVETAIYRVVQEALTNVARHAHARQVSVVVARHAGHVTAVVEDDGIGFDQEGAQHRPDGKRLGLLGMRERAALAGGTLEIESRPGFGTTVIARFPVAREGGGRP
ncbi:MAG TPA: ATP-binding protein [Isosphaeraceae bacterium]|nr:ATP-binding protein [Isosphaeraceae bacterium]